jgi:uncharacterized protein
MGIQGDLSFPLPTTNNYWSLMEPKPTVKEYLTALRQNRLMGVKCRECGFVTTPPRLACRRCQSLQTETVEVGGRGKIVSFTVVCIPPESHRGRTPYLVVLVELDEGSWIMGNLNGVDPANVTTDIIGRRVKMDNTLLPTEENTEIAPLFVLE